MRKAHLLVVLVLFPVSAARTQDIGFFGGYSFLRTTGANYENSSLSGWNAAVSANFHSWGVVADFSDHYGAGTSNFTPIGNRGHGTMFLFGPQYSFRVVPRVTPFVHGLFGGVQGAKATVAPGPGGACPSPGCSGPVIVPETALAMAFGGGLDVKVQRHLWLRLIQIDYVRQNFSNGAMDSPRISAGAVFRFGRP